MTYTSSPDSVAHFYKSIGSSAALWALFFIALSICITFYVLSCLGLMKIADKNGIRYSYLAWIPFINFFLIGKIAFKSTVSAIILLIFSFIYPYSFLLSIVTTSPNFKILFFSENSYYLYFINSNTSLSFIFAVIAIVFIVMYLVALYKIYKKMSTKAVMMLIFSVLSSGLLIPIFLFAIRNNSLRT